MQINPEKLETARELAQLQKGLRKERVAERHSISLCGGPGCASSGSKRIRDVFQDYLIKKNLDGLVTFRFTGCQGLCELGPLVIVYPGEIFYRRVSAGDVAEIVEKTVLGGEVVERLLYRDPASGAMVTHAREIPFYEKQKRLLTGSNWLMDSNSIEDYLSLNGYSALARVLTEMTSEQVIAEIKKSRLRGRGGAGFPTGVKWQECYEAVSEQKYIICNADEGDPGAFMDRSLLEGNPHLVLEGLLIGGYAVGANEGIVFVRAEYPLAVENVQLAVEQARGLGLLGENILGRGFSFNITVSIGAGAFVSGETSALVASVEGRAAEPRQKPPHLALRGLWGKPTVVNNVESLANIPIIIGGGVEEYLKTGTASSSGTKIFSLVGKVNNTGLVEVPLGMTLREIIFDIGGGIRGNKEFKAVQTGGPSGGCLPVELLDSPTDFEELSAAGSMMGSGGMIVMDEETCMVDVARYFLHFLSDESCGKCFSCREGICRMLEIVEDITSGRGTLEQLELLKELAPVVQDASMCGLGQTAANPVLSTLRYFEEEYREHILCKKCSAGVCKSLIRFSIDRELCLGCRACQISCPAKAIESEKEVYVIVEEKCSRCGICLETCKYKAINRISP